MELGQFDYINTVLTLYQYSVNRLIPMTGLKNNGLFMNVSYKRFRYQPAKPSYTSPTKTIFDEYYSFDESTQSNLRFFSLNYSRGLVTTASDNKTIKSIMFDRFSNSIK